VATLVGGEVAPQMENGGDEADVNFTEPKNNENLCGRFSYYK
jgi:hypothetical protein